MNGFSLYRYLHRLQVYEFVRAAVTKYHTWVVSTIEISSLGVLEARSPKPRFKQGWFLLRVLREGLFPVSFLSL